MNMRAMILALVLTALLLARSAAAYDANDPANCNGVDWDDKRPLAVAKVTAQPRVNFIKSPYDDDFTAASCPAATAACRKATYLVAGDLVLLGRARSAFTCVDYQSPLAKKQVWNRGWLPSAALSPVAPTPSPAPADWIGTWYHPGGSVEIKSGRGGKLHVEGEMTVPTAHDFHNGDFHAEVAPGSDTLTFTDAGNYGDECKVRLQRIGAWLLVEDNDGCGGAGVTFTGLYRRKN